MHTRHFENNELIDAAGEATLMGLINRLRGHAEEMDLSPPLTTHLVNAAKLNAPALVRGKIWVGKDDAAAADARNAMACQAIWLLREIHRNTDANYTGDIVKADDYWNNFAEGKLHGKLARVLADEIAILASIMALKDGDLVAPGVEFGNCVFRTNWDIGSRTWIDAHAAIIEYRAKAGISPPAPTGNFLQFQRDDLLSLNTLQHLGELSYLQAQSLRFTRNSFLGSLRSAHVLQAAFEIKDNETIVAVAKAAATLPEIARENLLEAIEFLMEKTKTPASLLVIDALSEATGPWFAATERAMAARMIADQAAADAEKDPAAAPVTRIKMTPI